MSKDAATTAPRSFARRDHLRANELRIQEQWAASKIYEVDPIEGRETFFLNFPYPYMNGRIHLGHAFSLTKAEFTARFQRLQGKNVLFPFGFHCTGMPIQAAANKLKEEIRQFGNPPVFPTTEELEAIEAAKRAEKGGKAEAPADEGKDAAAQIAAKSKGKKTKLLAKGAAGTPMRQWDILAKMVPEDEIASFVDPLKWLNYFPPYGASDLIAFGSAIDWRRSFITTSVNPYYDKFIRWQFNKLKESGRIKFGKRAGVFSPLDQQVCADHDRASGENVGPQEYTIIKLLIVQPYPENSPLHHESLVGRNVYLAPATLRPETMYGQTNCFVLPEGDYGAFELNNGDVFVISKRSAIGMAHQDLMKEWGKATSLVDMKGQDLIGLPLKAPNAAYDVVYTLPLTTISMGKGTGVVTSVPSDAPDDYAALRELQEKPLWREKFGVTAEMVEPFVVVPIIEIPGYGPASAVTMCEKLDIKSSKDKDKLKAAKDEVYLKGFYEGRMTVGECKGMTVQDAKPIIRQQLIDSGDAVPYYEPESLVMSRSGDECVVALTDQWYLSYGAEDWCNTVKAHIHSENFNMYNGKIMEKFDQVLDWLGEWACSRQFGLGTLMPWDEQWVIESLSDSTIYMAYYTIAQHFHGSLDNLSGTSNPNPKINADHLCDEVFDYIFLQKPLPAGFTTPIPESLLANMRGEFEYWYPFNLRVSAKDLIPNHLTMCLYNHVEIWKDRPELWPKGIYCNGHIQVDAEKMSKSKGNFLMLLECIEDFSADATRFACADAGDSMEDANFDRSVANNSISYLFTEEEFCRSVSTDAKDGKLRGGEMTFMDKCFNNEMDHLIEATFQEFEKMCYRDGIHRCWYDLLIARDLYRDWSTKCGIAYHQDVITRFVRILAVMMAPITPHWSEVIWEFAIVPESEGPKSPSIVDARWPSFTQYDRQLRKEYLFFRDAMKNMRQNQLKTKLAKGAPIAAYIYYSSSYDENKVQMLTWLQSQFDLSTKSFPATLSKDMKTWCESIPELKPQTKVLMQFGAFMRNEAIDRGLDALAIELPFDQVGILKANEVYVVKSLNLATLAYHDVNAEGQIPGDKKKYSSAVPGKPASHFYNEK